MIVVIPACCAARSLHAHDASAAQATEAFEPPDFPDSCHVANGCHVSALAYLARFAVAFPAEHSEPLVVFMSCFDHQKNAHTLALVSWCGQWWCRDDYFGVFPLNCAVKGEPNSDQLRARALPLLHQRKRERLQTIQTALPPLPPRHLTTAERLDALLTSARLLPFPSRLFEVRSDGVDVPVLLFRPSAHEVAVYEPLHGTCVAECELSNDEKVVALLVAQFGYRVSAVQPLRFATTILELPITPGQ